MPWCWAMMSSICSADLGLPGDLDALLDVGDQDQGAHGRGQLFMTVFAVLVFDKIVRFLNLSDVVVVGGHLGQERVGPGRLGRRLEPYCRRQWSDDRSPEPGTGAPLRPADPGWTAPACGTRWCSRRRPRSDGDKPVTITPASKPPVRPASISMNVAGSSIIGLESA